MAFPQLVLTKDLFQPFPDAIEMSVSSKTETKHEKAYTPSKISVIVLLAL
jgi:hypothetical protein